MKNSSSSLISILLVDFQRCSILVQLIITVCHEVTCIKGTRLTSLRSSHFPEFIIRTRYYRKSRTVESSQFVKKMTIITAPTSIQIEEEPVEFTSELFDCNQEEHSPAKVFCCPCVTFYLVERKLSSTFEGTSRDFCESLWKFSRLKEVVLAFWAFWEISGTPSHMMAFSTFKN